MPFTNTEESSRMEEMEIADLDRAASRYLKKHRKNITLSGFFIGVLILCIISIPLATILINSKIIQTKWNEKFNRFEYKLDFLFNFTSDVDADNNQLNQKIDKFQENFDNLEEKFDKFEEKIEKIEDDLKVLEIVDNRTRGIIVQGAAPKSGLS